jgi:hypothetical protein
MKNRTYNRRSHTVSTVKQVAGHDLGGLLAQERRPGGGYPPWRRVEPVAAQGHADRGGRDPNAEVQQLALDGLVAPAGVVGGEADDQQLHVLVESRPAGVAVRVGPGAGDEAPVPAQQRVGLDQEAGPDRPGQHAADRGQQRPVSRLEPGSWDLAVKDGELVAQHQDLQVFGGVAAGEQHERLHGAVHREVRELR